DNNYTTTRLGKFYKFITSVYTALVVIAFCGFSYWYLDQPIAIYMHKMVTKEIYKIANFVTHFGMSTYYIIIFSLLFLLTQFILRKLAIAKIFLFILLSIVVPGIICDILKVIFSRYRPMLLISEHLYGFSFFKFNSYMWSFPSGHSATIAGLM